jgi:signal transduction histidine kinase
MSLGYFFSVSLTDRIVGLNQAARQIAQGHLASRVPASGRDEIANLANTFNEMAAQLEASAQRQRDLEALRRDLIAWVGHDLRTPLASIRVIVEALADGVVQDGATVERYLQTAQHQIRSLSLLLDDLFELAQIDVDGLQLEWHLDSISDLISDTIEGFSALAAQQGIELQGSVAGDVGPVLMDAPKIERVIANLLDNALRHTPAGGVVQVTACAEPGCVQVEVRDTGEGVDALDLPHIFERFYRGEKSRNRSTGGAGLGLAIASGIVRAHGGRIGAESTVGEGTRIWFSLPAGRTSASG